MPDQITLHHLSNSKSTRILMLLEELGLEYKIERYTRQPNNLAPPELLKVSPIGQAPVITIHQADGGSFNLAESGAIIEYLLEEYPNDLKPDKNDRKEYAKYIYWLHFAEGSLATWVTTRHVLKNASNDSTNAAGNIIEPRIKRALDVLEAELKIKGDFLMGNKVSGADFIMHFGVDSASDLLGDYPLLQKYWARLKELPSYKKAVEIGGAWDSSKWR